MAALELDALLRQSAETRGMESHGIEQGHLSLWNHLGPFSLINFMFMVIVANMKHCLKWPLFSLNSIILLIHNIQAEHLGDDKYTYLDSVL